MGRSLLIKLMLVALLLALVSARNSVERDRAADRAVSGRVQRLLPEADKVDMRVAAVTLRRGERSLLYARQGGVWRCREVYGAVADWAAIQGLVDVMLDAEGEVASDVPARFADYGIGTEQSWRVTFHGPGLMKQPDQDVLFDLELGFPLGALGGCFVRVPGQDRVLVIERDPMAVLLPRGSNPDATPLLDAKLIPSVWLSPGERVERVAVEREDGVAYGLDLRDRGLSAERLATGESPKEWVLVHPDGREEITSPGHSIAYTVFLGLVEWAGLVDPARTEELGLNRLTARVSVSSERAGTTLLSMGPTTADGYVPVTNDWSQMIMALPTETADLLSPDPAALVDPTGPNPWEPWLVAASQRMLEGL